MGLLKHSVELENGLVAENVYYKIESFQGNSEFVLYIVSAYSSQEAANIGSPVLFKRAYSFPYVGTDVFANGYSQLKAIHEFSNAEDV
ncbi:hypothetical protein QQ991_03290 [Weizmannia coagulans]|uniref:Uncharacterized protein n=1 Tax=Heyndrickxia faecalis TaxID=2824910 RepID=A0ABV3NJQ4_9BACI|nr:MULTISPECIES: hypothetical protein [Heyndrickxia]ATW84504.1 hypothetical protein CIW84_16855 [Heyndrickxia coagulans]KGB30148.1 hypothetical protein IE89_06475 [Heyndrickxia coagulans]KXT21132.1 hypothetical protein UZ35_06090 [Heyndrickxia coagulans]MCR4445390.1 hypothetical protein [Heyndrickxia coagulans]MCU6438287.1 hypothetical protein [Heyndrickxia coagulans]